MSTYPEMTLQEFVDLTGSDAPAPGGGSVAALAGALGAALAQMVAELTVGREKYAEAEDTMQAVRTEAAAIKQELLETIEKDSSSFNGYMRALRLPKDTEEEKAVRREAMQNGLKEASLVPLHAAETAVRILPLAKKAAQLGNANAVSDALVSAMMTRSAVISAVLNCRINLQSIRDEDFVKEYGARADELVRRALIGEREVLALSSLTADCL